MYLDPGIDLYCCRSIAKLLQLYQKKKIHLLVPRVLCLHSLAATALQAVPKAVLSWHLELVWMHPPAPRAPFMKFLGATGLQVAPLVALSWHLGLAGKRPLVPTLLYLHLQLRVIWEEGGGGQRRAAPPPSLGSYRRRRDAPAGASKSCKQHC